MHSEIRQVADRCPDRPVRATGTFMIPRRRRDDIKRVLDIHKCPTDAWETAHSGDSIVTAITTGAVSSGPLTNSICSIGSVRCGCTAR